MPECFMFISLSETLIIVHITASLYYDACMLSKQFATEDRNTFKPNSSILFNDSLYHL